MNALETQLLAQVPSALPPIGTGPGLGPLSNAPTLLGGSGPVDAAARVMSTMIGALTLAAGIYFMFQFILGAFGWLSASGDKAKLEKAQNRITQAMLGLLIVVAAYAIVSIIGTVLGLDILLTKPCDLITALSLGTVPCP